MRRLCTAFVVAGIGLSCAAEMAAGYERLAVSTSDNHLVVRYISCPAEDIEYVRLYELDSDQIALDEGDVMLWESIHPSEDELASGVRIADHHGNPMPFQTRHRYFLELKSSQGLVDTDAFSPDDLTSGVRVNRSTLPLEEYERAARQSCE